MGKTIIKQEEQKPLTPGFGVAGQVMCPHFKNMCMKQGCEMWVELKYGDQPVARCAYAWNTVLNVELRQSVDKLTAVVSTLIKGGK